jgi:hypothetical protein
MPLLTVYAGINTKSKRVTMHRLYEGYSGKHYRVVVNTLLSSYAHPSEVSSMSAARAFCREGYWMSVFYRDAQHPSSTLVHHILPAYRYIAQDSAYR